MEYLFASEISFKEKNCVSASSQRKSPDTEESEDIFMFFNNSDRQHDSGNYGSDDNKRVQSDELSVCVDDDQGENDDGAVDNIDVSSTIGESDAKPEFSAVVSVGETYDVSIFAEDDSKYSGEAEVHTDPIAAAAAESGIVVDEDVIVDDDDDDDDDDVFVDDSKGNFSNMTVNHQAVEQEGMDVFDQLVSFADSSNTTHIDSSSCPENESKLLYSTTTTSSCSKATKNQTIANSVCFNHTKAINANKSNVGYPGNKNKNLENSECNLVNRESTTCNSYTHSDNINSNLGSRSCNFGCTISCIGEDTSHHGNDSSNHSNNASTFGNTKSDSHFCISNSSHSNSYTDSRPNYNNRNSEIASSNNSYFGNSCQKRDKSIRQSSNEIPYIGPYKKKKTVNCHSDGNYCSIAAVPNSKDLGTYRSVNRRYNNTSKRDNQTCSALKDTVKRSPNRRSSGEPKIRTPILIACLEASDGK
ncbi:hypothetical protein ElyMa_004453600 [Elysia marginata]|uniref:Uncharacterized protein n=1 Tax=Elysia marginata TaxID=1093978 RepID=A0AAV4HEE9_9GAST|nr:hypothetical protein ElyMa_004453600 [Elysia marginata]